MMAPQAPVIPGARPLSLSLPYMGARAALLWHDGKWIRPLWSTLTTHILKLLWARRLGARRISAVQ